MKIKLSVEVPGVGKAGEVVEVEQEQGSNLVCQGVCTVEEFDSPTKRQLKQAAKMKPVNPPKE